MKIKLSNIYNDRPYYEIVHEDGKVDYAFGAKQVKKIVERTRQKDEKVQIEEAKFLDEHSKLLKLIK